MPTVNYFLSYGFAFSGHFIWTLNSMSRNSQCNAIKIYSCDSPGTESFVPALILFHLKDSFQFAHQPDDHLTEPSCMFLGG